MVWLQSTWISEDAGGKQMAHCKGLTEENLMIKLFTEWWVRLMECNRDDETLTQELATTKLLPPLGWAEWIGKAGMDDTRPWRELGAKEERWRSRKLKPFTYHHQNSQETGRELESWFWSEASAHPTLVAKPTGIQRAAGCGWCHP